MRRETPESALAKHPTTSPDMRIAILANLPVWTLPGLEHLHHSRHYATWLEPLLPEFANAEGFDIHWITMCKETREDLHHEAYGQHFHILSRGSLAVQMLTGYVSEVRRIRKVLKEISPDVLHAWGSEDVYGLAGVRSGIGNRLFTLQGCLTEYLRLLGGDFLFRVQTRYEAPTIRRYHDATAESPGAAKLLKDINPDLEVSLVDYGVNAEFFDASWDPAPEPEVLFVGSLTARKGIADLVSIAGRPELRHVSFKVIGAGPERTKLEEIASDNVVWLGTCSRDEVVDALRSAWALYIPTYADTGPTVIKEARVIGLPIVTTTGAGACSYVEDEQCGFVTEPGDLDSQADAVQTLTSSRDKAKEYGSRGYASHLEQLHPSTTVKCFTALYRKLASRTSPVENEKG